MNEETPHKPTLGNYIILILFLLLSFLIGFMVAQMFKSPLQQVYTITHFQTVSVIAEKKDCEKQGGVFEVYDTLNGTTYAAGIRIRCEIVEPNKQIFDYEF